MDLSNNPDLITKTDVVVNDKNFIEKFRELLRGTQNLKIDNKVIEHLINSLEKNTSSVSKIEARISFVLTLLSERKFFINLIRSLLGIVNRANSELGPNFSNDPYLTNEFDKLT